MPFTAFTVVVPDSVPPAPLSVAVTGFTAPATTPLATSCTWITGCGDSADPFAAPPGAVPMTSFVAGSEVMVIGPDVAPVSPAALKAIVYVPAPVTTRSVKVAVPFTAFTVVVPPSVPPAPTSVAVTALVAPATTPLDASCTWMTGCVPSALPVPAPDGCVWIESFVAGSAVMPMLPEVACVSAPELNVSV